MRKKLRNGFSILLSIILLVTMETTSIITFAENQDNSLCPHHPEHTEECGYIAGSNCSHEHTADCGEQAKTCPHEHDENCGYNEGSPCTFDPASCEECMRLNNKEPELQKELKCVCMELCTEGNLNADCPVCSVEGEDLATCAGIIPIAEPRLQVEDKNIIYTIDESNGTAEIVGHTFTDEMLSKNFSFNIPSTIDVDDIEYRVVSVGEGAFQNLGQNLSEKKFISFSWGSNLEKIGAHAFDNCNFEVGFLRLPNSVKEIGEYAFQNWTVNQLNLEFSTELVSLPEGVFAGLQSSGTVKLAPNLTYIHSNAFINASPIKNLTVYGTEELIKDCVVLSSATKITYIDPYAEDDDWLREQIEKAPDGINTTIVIKGGIDIHETVIIPSGKHITLVDDGKAHTITDPSLNEITLFKIESGASLTITTSTGEDGLLILKNGYPQDSTGSIITMEGGEFHLEHGTLQGGHTYNGRTATILVKNKGKFYMTGGVIEGMRIESGAASGSLTLIAPVVVYGGCYFEMSGGEIRGNSIFSSKAVNCSGGVVLSGWTQYDDPAMMKLTGNAKITGNGSNDGGGITMIGQAHLNMDGGFISENQGGYGGGISIIGRSGGGGDDCKFTMDGGVISGNTALNAGGGIYLNCSGVALHSGRIEGNTARQGGGVYVSEPPHKVEIYNALITGNDASVMGGGLWFCPTGDATFAVTNGVAVYGNTAVGAGDDFVALKGNEGVVTLADRLLGGGSVEWYQDGAVIGDTNNPNIPPQNVLGQVNETIPRFDFSNPGNRLTEISGSDNYALKAVVSDNAIKLAENQAKLLITGNHADRGGGIGSNGAAILGEENRDYTLRVTKAWSADTPQNRKTEVTVSLKVGDIVLDSIILNAGNNWTAEFTQLPDPVSLDGVDYAVIESPVAVFTPSYSDAVIDPTTNTITIKITNIYSPSGSLTVSKNVAGDAGEKNKDFNFTVILGDTSINGDFGEMHFTNGIAEFALKHGESKTATDLPIDIIYTVTETEANQNGYSTSATDASDTITENGSTAVFLNEKNSDKPDPDPEEQKKPETSVPNTGDGTHLTLWLVLLGISFIGIVVTLIAVQQKDKQSDK